MFVFFDVLEVCVIGFKGDGGEAQDQEAKEILGLFFFAGVELIKGGAKPADALFLGDLGGMELVEGVTWTALQKRHPNKQQTEDEARRSKTALHRQRVMIPFWRS